MNILIADDDPVTLKLLMSKIAEWGHTVHPAADGNVAWDTILQTPIDIVISDWLMPGLDGLQLSHLIRERQDHPYIYVIVISVQNSKSDIIQGLESGVDDYITKPIDMEALHARINIGVRIVELERALNRKIEIITANHHQTIRMFSQIIESFDEDLGGHCRRTAKLAVSLAKRHPGVGEDEISVIETAALLHDVGMVGIPKTILNKRRTERINYENQLYQSHADIGAKIIGEIEIMRPAARLVRMHHEQFNGKGFPDGVQGDQIPIGAQLISAASIYDNMHVKGKIPFERITEELQRIRGYQLSPAVVALLIELNVQQQQAAKERTSERLFLDKLMAGMVLADNVYMKTGAFVMAGDTILDDYKIEKLKHYQNIGAIDEKVLIQKKPARR